MTFSSPRTSAALALLFTSSGLAALHADSAPLVTLAPEQLKADFTLLRQTCEQVHPNLYFTTSKQAFDAKAEQIDAQLNRPLTPLEFYQTIAPLIKGIGEDHTAIVPPPGAAKERRTGPPIPDYPWHFEVLDGNIGYLDFVSMDEEPKFEQFLAATFQTIKAKPIAGLIIDLRKNGGGNSDLGVKLLDYVNEKPYREIARKEWRLSPQYLSIFTDAFKEFWTDSPSPSLQSALAKPPDSVVKSLFTQNPPIELKKMIQEKGPSWMKTYLGRYAPHWLDLSYSPETASQTLSLDVSQLRQPTQPFPLRYHGPTCFLVGPITFSSAIILGNAVEDFKLATIIGEETRPCNQFGEPYFFTLPHSGLHVRVASAQYVRANGDAKNPHGIIPHIPVKPTPEDEAKGIDPVLAAAKDWVRRQPTVP